MKSRKILIAIITLAMIFSFVPALASVSHSKLPTFEENSFFMKTTESSNWAGYAVVSSNDSVHNASMSMIIPTTDTSGNSYAAFWVGIDGYNDQTVEQTGILAEPSGHGHNSQTIYCVWYEFYPSAPVYASFTASAGDYVYANVTYDGGSSFSTFISVTTSSGNLVGTFSGHVSVKGARDDSAEWITEAPASSTGILPLANFGTVDYGHDYTGIKLTNYATIGGHFATMGSFSLTGIIMVNQQGQSEATPSAISSDGTSFTVTYDQSSTSHSHHP